jgi:AcrR family transcriptional regulator
MATTASPTTSSSKGRTRKRGAQARGLARREQLLDAAIDLLSELPPEDISLYDVADRAGIPPASTYHFYPNIAAIYAALAERFGEELNAALAEPYTGAEAENWRAIVETSTRRAHALYQARPDYRRLILGGTAPSEVKLSDREHDVAVGEVIIAAVNAHFELPDFPRRTDIFYYAVEMADLMFMLSQIRHGEITPEMGEEAARAMVAYLRSYLPEHLPQKTEPEPDL